MSALQSFVKQRLEVPEVGTWNRVTVKLDDEHHEKVKQLAAAMSLSKSAASEQILARAIDDAWALYLDTLNDQERFEVLHDLDTTLMVREYEMEQDFDRQAAGELSVEQEALLAREEKERQHAAALRHVTRDDPEERALKADDLREAGK